MQFPSPTSKLKATKLACLHLNATVAEFSRYLLSADVLDYFSVRLQGKIVHRYGAGLFHTNNESPPADNFLPAGHGGRAF